MAKDVTKTKAEPAPKKEAVATEKTTPAPDTAKAADTPAKIETGDATSAAPKNYSRGEGQKPVTQAYKDNWNAIFGKKTDKKKKKR